METNTPSRKTFALTRRGRLALVVSGAVLASTAVAVPLLDAHGGGAARPRTLVIEEGWRARQVYAAVDKALALPAGSTQQAVAKASLKLPNAAEGNPEGYLFPATYPIDAKTTPQSLLSAMVEAAHQKFGAAPVAAGAEPESMNLHQAVTIASIVQAESATKADMGKVARVVLNRMERGVALQMDSTLDYALDRAAGPTTLADRRLESPYNSFRHMGLPPTPIDNPGQDAMRAALHPTPGNWLYFVTAQPGTMRFTADYDQYRRDVAAINAGRSSPTAHSSASTRPAK
jgi:UPF0755 protein